MPVTRIQSKDLLTGSVEAPNLNAAAITGQSAATSADDDDLILIYDDDASALRKMTRAHFTAGITGDITGVTAGSGLTGGGLTGDVTLAIDDSVVATISGSNFAGNVGVTGSLGATLGFSGSLTRLLDGKSYIASDNTDIIITSASNGQIVIGSNITTTLSAAYDGGVFITASNGPVDIQRTNNADAATSVLKLAVSGTVSGGGNAGPQILFTVPVSGESKVGAAIRANKFAASENDSTTELNFLTSGNDENLDRILKIDNTGVAVQGLGSSEVFPSSGYAFMVAASGYQNALVLENSTGDVGIGLTNPLVPLHVYRSNTSTLPQISAQQGSTGDAAYFFSIPNCSFIMGIDNSDDDKFKISYGSNSTNATLGSSNRLAIDVDGNVGIANDTPTSKLTVNGVITSTGSIKSTVLGDQNEIMIVGADNVLSSSNLLAIDTTNQRVGIGTTSPSVKLDIVGEAVNETQIRLAQHNTDSDAPDIRLFKSRGTEASPTAVANDDNLARVNSFAYNGSSYVQAGTFGWSADGTNGDSYFTISTRVGSSTTDKLEIDKFGDVIVFNDLAVSGSQLKITNSGDASIFIEADTDNATEADNPFLKMSQDGGLVTSIIGHCGATDKDPENNTYTGAVSNNLLIGTLDSNGGVQIGTNDNVRITVESDGDVKLVSTKDDTTSSSANLFINSSTGFLARSTSDRRQKKDITAISSSLDDLCRLSPRHFYDVNDENNEVRIAGFVADEVQAVFPELVPERDLPDEIYRSVAYDRLGAYIVSAIKEIKQRLEALENGG